jgi:predicted nucleic acid-binding protein
MADLLVDTDVFIDHLRGHTELPLVPLAYSVVTRAELFAGEREDDDHIRLLLAPHEELEADRRVAEVAGQIRRRTGLAIADGLIAGTAVVHGIALLTRNVRHFGRVDGLRLAGP